MPFLRNRRIKRSQPNIVPIYKPGMRPSTEVGKSVAIGPYQTKKIRKGSSARMKGGSVQNRRQTPKTYI